MPLEARDITAMDSGELNALIDALEAAVRHETGRKDWRPIWADIKRISLEFKGTRYPSRETRQGAWERFQSIVEDVKQRQSVERKELERQASVSAEKKAPILEAARDATPISLFTEDIDNIFTFGLASITKALLNVDTDERLQTLQHCSRRIKEGWTLLEENKRDMLGRDKAECFQKLKEAQESLNAAWQQWKSWQSEERQRRMEHRREKREQFEAAVRGRIANLNERRLRLYGVLAHKEAHRDELHEKLTSARSDEYRARVSGWIEEEQDSMVDIKNKLEEIERWIDEEKDKLN